jgi:hypothetical protein
MSPFFVKLNMEDKKMPLKSGKKNIGANYRELNKSKTKRSRAQKVAIVLQKAGLSKKSKTKSKKSK